jgi:AcrR family transcriptional regulator
MRYHCKEKGFVQDNKAFAPEQSAAADSPMCDRIIGAAFDLFMEKGYARTSTLEIATRARVSKRDLYASFASKPAILLACITNRASRMRLAPDLPPPRTAKVLAATLVAFGTTVLLEVSHPQVMAMFRLAIAEAAHAPAVARTLMDNRMVNRGAIAALMAGATSSGVLVDGDPQQMMEDYFGLLWGDLLISQLMNAATAPKRGEAERKAQRASSAFLRLYARGRRG